MNRKNGRFGGDAMITREIAALAIHKDLDGQVEHWLAAPLVGVFRGRFTAGDLIREGQVMGELQLLGERMAVVVPRGSGGRIREILGPGAVGYKTPILRLDDYGQASQASHESAAGMASTQADQLVLRAPFSGRVYLRPSPSEPWFVTPGDGVQRGQVVALLEVMKTFHRVAYQGEDLPETAEVLAVLVEHEGDVDVSTPLFSFKSK